MLCGVDNNRGLFGLSMSEGMRVLTGVNGQRLRTCPLFPACFRIRSRASDFAYTRRVCKCIRLYSSRRLGRNNKKKKKKKKKADTADKASKPQ
jgi:hypothetical protein